VRFVVDRAALGQGFLRELRVSPVNITPQMLTLFIYTLLLPESETGEDGWEPSKKKKKKRVLLRKSDSTG